MGEAGSRNFIPAAGHDWLLPFYDPVWKLLGGESTRQQLVDQAEIRPGHRILDIGCGTGSLIVQIKRLHPDADVIGLDPDPKALARAKRKADRAGLAVRFEQGFSDELPYPDASFDRVFSSFMFHHLGPDEQTRTLREVRRVLRPGCSLHLVDFGGGATPLMREAGLTDASVVTRRRSLFGRIAYDRANAP